MGFKDKLAAKVCLFSTNKESLHSLLKLDAIKLFLKYEEVMATKASDSEKYDQLAETLGKVQKKLEFQEEQKEIYEKQLSEIMDILKFPAGNRSFENILPEIRNLKESLGNIQGQIEVDNYANAQAVLESYSRPVISLQKLDSEADSESE